VQTGHDKKDIFINIYNEKACNISEACKAIDISRTTYYNWLSTDPVFKKEIQDAEASMIDYVEGQLLTAIKRGNITAMIFFLTNRASDKWKHKNYQEQAVGFDFDQIVVGEKFAKHFENMVRHDMQKNGVKEIDLDRE
jgi:hypothetical protein